MTRFVPVDVPLSDSDREYLHARGEHDRVEYIDGQHGKADEAAAGEDLFGDSADKPYTEWTVSELDTEIEARNNDPARPADKKLAKTGKIGDKAARLVADDEWLDQQ